VATAALVIFGGSQIAHASGFLAVYLAGIIIGNRPTRAHNSVVTFLDAATWLAQIVMFVLLGLLVSPHRLLSSIVPAVIVALVLMLVARPLAVLVCLAPFVSTGGKRSSCLDRLRGGRDLLASIPMLVGLSKAYLYFDVACRRPSSRCCCRAGPWRPQPGGCMWRCRAAIAGRGASSLICPASSNSNWSAIRCARKPVLPSRPDTSWSKRRW